MSSDNPIGADNQQERLGDYFAGYIDGEGSFHVGFQRNKTTRLMWQVVPEFHVGQHVERASVLYLLQAFLGCGRIRPNGAKGGKDKTLVFVVRNRKDLLERVIPFLEKHPLLSVKAKEFATFASIVRAMDAGEHLTQEGLERICRQAVKMNGGGRYRKTDWLSRILRGHMPNTI